MKTSDYILKTNREYSLYVCGHRAIPNIEDGLKPSQRMALWLLRNKAGKIKVSALSGMLAAEKIYVHGEVSANNAIGLLAAPYKNNTPLIQGEGMFGTRTNPGEIGAARYVEVMRAPAAEALLYRDLDLVPLQENYDGSTMQPIHFLPLVPLVLLNGVEGIAIGWATSILPRSLRAIVEACQAALQGKKIKPLVPHYDRYDVDVRKLAVNQWEISGKVKLEDTSSLRITELPPGFNVEKYIGKLIAMEDDDTIAGFIDNSSETIDIIVKFKRGSIKDWTEEKAIDFLKLREKVSERIIVVGYQGTTIKPYSCAEDVITDFVEWRLGWYTKRFNKLILDTTEEVLYWYLLRALFESGFTKKLGTFANRASMEEEVLKVAKKAKITPGDANVSRALGLATYRWTQEFEGEIRKKIVELESSLNKYRDIVSSPELLKGVYLSELNELRKAL